MKFVYKQNYGTKLFSLALISVLLCIFSGLSGYSLVSMPNKNVSEYHLDILTVNSILSGFSLTNLGILLSIADDQLIKKLEGTDILQKRNIVIGHSIIFGSVSMFLSIFCMLKFNLSFLESILGGSTMAFLREFLFYLEIFSLVISILYFILSIKKMLELLSLVHVPRKRYTEEQIDRMREQLSNTKQSK